MKTVNCYNCRSGQQSFYASENGFTLVKCSGCGLLYVNPRPDDSDILQAHCQGKHRGLKDFDINGAFDPDKVTQYLNVLRDIFNGDLGNDKTWLDIGCGHGEFIIAIQKYGQGRVNVEGTEPNVYKQRSARKRGLNVSYFDLTSHPKRYDFLSILNVYSHLPDPPASLNSWKRLLKPGGELILETGDTAGFDSKDHYRPFYLPDHLSFASEGIILDILKRLDFEILSVNKYPLIVCDLITIVKETVKAVNALLLPQHKYSSKLRYLPKHKKYTMTDMFIRARLNN
jgi:SAM-dependent methyltransferase